MERFSERMGLRPIKQVIQVDTMDDDLRVSLWNAVGGFFFRNFNDNSRLSRDGDADRLLSNLWVNCFKLPLDERPTSWLNARQVLRERVFTLPWLEVYDFIEFVAGAYGRPSISLAFVEECNRILKREMSAYRFVRFKLVRITSEQELAAIEDALHTASPIQPVRDHLQNALSLLSDRKSPDYRNSMKESISAVEAVCQLLAGDPHATLGSALNAIQKSGKVELHSALKDAMTKLYGYTSDADGIRHALKDTSTVDYEDAMFMLTVCAGYVSYLTAKAQKAGIALEKQE